MVANLKRTRLAAVALLVLMAVSALGQGQISPPKFGQYTVATKDGRTVVDVAVYVSTLIMDSDSTNDLLAAFLGFQCNMNWLINGGIVPKSDLVLDVGDTPEGGLPKTFSLMDNYPNPFNPATEIRYTVAAPSPEFAEGSRGQTSRSSVVSLKVYDLLGREIATLVDAAQMPGTYRVTWNASGLSSGVYLYRLEAGSFVQTRKMMLLK